MHCDGNGAILWQRRQGSVAAAGAAYRLSCSALALGSPVPGGHGLLSGGNNPRLALHAVDIPQGRTHLVQQFLHLVALDLNDPPRLIIIDHWMSAMSAPNRHASRVARLNALSDRSEKSVATMIFFITSGFCAQYHALSELNIFHYIML